jgi:uncharacterized protein YbaR (Trm112 family)
VFVSLGDKVIWTRQVGKLLHMSPDPQLLEMISCPAADRAPLRFDADAQTLTCTSCARVYPVKDGLPVLLLDETLEVG